MLGHLLAEAETRPPGADDERPFRARPRRRPVARAGPQEDPGHEPQDAAQEAGPQEGVPLRHHPLPPQRAEDQDRGGERQVGVQDRLGLPQVQQPVVLGRELPCEVDGHGQAHEEHLAPRNTIGQPARPFRQFPGQACQPRVQKDLSRPPNPGRPVEPSPARPEDLMGFLDAIYA